MAAIEFQMTVRTVQDIFERQINPYLSNACTGWAVGDRIVDHLELGGPIRLVNRSCRVQASVPLDVYLVTQQELVSSVNKASAMQAVRIQALYDITISDKTLAIGYRDVSLGELGDSAPPEILKKIKGDIHDFLIPLGFSKDLGLQLSIIDPNHAITITAEAIATDGHVLTVRFEVDKTEGGNPGAALKARPLPVRLAGQPVAIWIDGVVLERIAQANVIDTIKKQLPGAESNAQWLPDGTTPRVRNIIRFKVPKIPDPFSATAVVTVDVSFGMAPYGIMGGGTVLQTSVAWDWDVEGDFVTEAFAGLVKMLGIGIGGISLPEGAVQTGDQSFVTSRTIPTDQLGPATLTFGRVSVVDEGMALSGLAHFHQLPDLYPLTISRRDWFVGYTATCSGREKDPTDKNRVVHAGASFTIHEPGSVCRVLPVGIPSDIVSRFVTIPGAKADPYTVTVVIPEAALRTVLQNYAGDFLFQVVTARGIRNISLGRPKVSFTEDDRVQNPDVEFINDCPWELVDPWVRKFHVFNPKWHIDPSPELWRQRMAGVPVMKAVSIRGFGVSTRLVLTTEDFGQRTSSPFGSKRFAADFLMPVTARESTAQLALAETNGNGIPPSDIEIENRLLQRVTALSLDSPVSGIALGVFQERPVLMVGLPDRVALYALEDLAETPLIAEFDAYSAQGFISTNDLVLAYGESGLVAFDGAEINTWIETPVLGVQRLPGSSLIAALTENGISVLEPDGHEVNFIEAPGALGILSVDQKLILALPDGLQCFSTDGVALTSIAISSFEGITMISETPAALGDSVIAVIFEDRSARLVDILNTGEIEVLAELDAVPWFANIATNEKLVVFPDIDTENLVLYQVN